MTIKKILTLGLIINILIIVVIGLSHIQANYSFYDKIRWMVSVNIEEINSSSTSTLWLFNIKNELKSILLRVSNISVDDYDISTHEKNINEYVENLGKSVSAWEKAILKDMEAIGEEDDDDEKMSEEDELRNIQDVKIKVINIKVYTDLFLSMIKNNDREFVSYYNNQLKHVIDSLSSQIIEMKKESMSESVEEADSLKDIVDSSVKLSVVLFIISVALGTLLMKLFSKKITIPLLRFSNEIANANKKDYEIVERLCVFTKNKDEIGLLATNFTNLFNEIRTSEANLVEALVKAKHASQAKTDFLANMSHEIRTPINGITGLLDLVLNTDLDKRQLEFLTQAKSSSQTLLSVINDILDFSKIEAGKLDIEKIEFYLEDTLDNIGNLFRKQAGDKGIELIISYPTCSMGALIGDNVRLTQVLTNLVGNAIKFTKHGEVFIRALPLEKDDDHILLEFSVKDTGIGVEKGVIDKLFEPFEQADTSTTRKYGGTGLGLAISKKIVEILDGNIWCDSIPSKGTTFYFTVKFGYKPKEKRSPLVLPPELKDTSVLLLEQNHTTSKALKDILINFSLKVFIVDKDESAIENLSKTFEENKSFNMVFIDFSPSKAYGLGILENIINFTKDLQYGIDVPKFVATTTTMDKTVLQMIDRSSIDGVLVKPASPSIVFDTIMDIFGNNVLREYRKDITKLDRRDIIEKVGGARVLLTEDNEINQQVAVEILTMVGLIVDVANNGQDSVNKINENNYDIVFMDVQMPIMDGYEATKLIRKQDKSKDLPIIAMTAHALRGDQEKCIEAGMDDYVSKPINIDDLYKVLTKWIKPSPDRQIDVDDILNKTEKKDSDGELFAGLSVFDVEPALKRISGDQNLYLKLLVRFKNQYSDIEQKLRRMIFEENDIYNAKMIAHTIKSSAGNIGAISLSDKAKNLEETLKGSNLDSVPVLLDEFKESMKEAIDEIESIVDDGTGQGVSSVTGVKESMDFDGAKVSELFERLKTLLDDGDADASECFNELKEMITGMVSENILQEIEGNIETFKFKEAMEHIEVIAKDFT